MTGKLCVLEREKPAACGTPGKRSATGSPPPVAAKPDWKVLSIMVDPPDRTDVRPNNELRDVILEALLAERNLRLVSARYGHTWHCTTCGERRGPYDSAPDNGLRSAARHAVEHAENAHGAA